MTEEKHVDEAWKDSIEKEKGTEPTPEETSHIPEASFSFFVTTLGIQVTIALGEIPNPITNKQEENLEQAKYLIDTLTILEEKTKNNLTPEESQLLEHLLYDFRMKYSSKKAGIQT